MSSLVSAVVEALGRVVAHRGHSSCPLARRRTQTDSPAVRRKLPSEARQNDPADAMSMVRDDLTAH